MTKGIVPIFLGSSFAFIAPIIKASELYGMAGALSGMVAADRRIDDHQDAVFADVDTAAV